MCLRVRIYSYVKRNFRVALPFPPPPLSFLSRYDIHTEQLSQYNPMFPLSSHDVLLFEMAPKKPSVAYTTVTLNFVSDAEILHFISPKVIIQFFYLTSLFFFSSLLASSCKSHANIPKIVAFPSTKMLVNLSVVPPRL